MSHDATYRRLFGELRERFSKPPERRIFLQLCGYLVHIWETYGERADHELSSYAIEGFANFQRRIPTHISEEMLPEYLFEDPFVLQGDLLQRAILSDCAWLAGLRAFEIAPMHIDIPGLAMHAETLARLAPENMKLSFMYAEGVTALLEHFDYVNLRVLEVSSVDSEESRALLLEHLTTRQGRLRVLDLGTTPLTSSQAMKVLDAPLCSELRCLRVGITRGEEAGSREFEHASLERLILSRSWSAMGYEPRNLLQGSYPSLAHVTIEGLRFDEFTDERPLFPSCPNLKRLDILESSFRGTVEPNRANPLGRLIEEGVFENLTHLTIQDSMNDPSAIRILLESGQLDNLRHLDLYGNHLWDEGARALLAHDGLEHLERLELRRCDIPEELQPALEARFPRATVTF